MEIRPIPTDKDHRAALAEVDANWGAAAGTDAGDRLDVLLALVDRAVIVILQFRDGLPLAHPSLRFKSAKTIPFS